MATPVIGVMGGSVVDADTEALAEAVGAAIAQRGWFVLNGGRKHGVMDAVSRGAKGAGGFVVGVLPGTREDHEESAHLDLRIYTGIGFARNAMNVLTSDVVLVLPGSTGTLSEAAYAVTYGRPTVLLAFDDKHLLGDKVRRVATVEEAMAACESALASQP